MPLCVVVVKKMRCQYSYLHKNALVSSIKWLAQPKSVERNNWEQALRFVLAPLLLITCPTSEITCDVWCGTGRPALGAPSDLIWPIGQSFPTADIYYCAAVFIEVHLNLPF